jgi:hypothetical protein
VVAKPAARTKIRAFRPLVQRSEFATDSASLTAEFRMAIGSTDSIVASTGNMSKKGIITIPVNVPERAGEEIRTPDVQLGKMHIAA